MLASLKEPKRQDQVSNGQQKDSQLPPAAGTGSGNADVAEREVGTPPFRCPMLKNAAQSVKKRPGVVGSARVAGSAPGTQGRSSDEDTTSAAKSTDEKNESPGPLPTHRRLAAQRASHTHALELERIASNRRFAARTRNPRDPRCEAWPRAHAAE